MTKEVSLHLKGLLNVISAALAAGLLKELTFGNPASAGPTKAVAMLYVLGFAPSSDRLYLGANQEAELYGDNTLVLAELNTVAPVGTAFVVGETVNVTIEIDYKPGYTTQSVQVAKIAA
ncbi:MAG TPA: hypothetical protein VNG90_05290 [Candidatus Acidoferrum sp.]|nr:hypothetical protein [Candidatus Acidoferrum sp.]